MSLPDPFRRCGSHIPQDNYSSYSAGVVSIGSDGTYPVPSSHFLIHFYPALRNSTSFSIPASIPLCLYFNDISFFGRFFGSVGSLRIIVSTAPAYHSSTLQNHQEWLLRSLNHLWLRSSRWFHLRGHHDILWIQHEPGISCVHCVHHTTWFSPSFLLAVTATSPCLFDDELFGIMGLGFPPLRPLPFGNPS